MNTTQFFNLWKPYNFQQRQKSIESLRKDVEVNRKWNNEHRKAIKQLIVKLEDYQKNNP